ncbi:MAG: hypothetical protein GX130_02130 [Candidatus Hydrogenedens sp.]|jgi:hypothetical protein|nr:hypothetical protein [Candidatus Hydrogenedens sp.]
MRTFFFIATLLFMAANVFAFNEPTDEVGSLLVVLDVPDQITEKNDPLECSVKLSSTGEALTGQLLLSSIDGWKVDPADKIDFSLKKEESLSIGFTVHVAADSFNAIYPLHAHVHFIEEGEEKEAHAVQLIYTRFTDVPQPEYALPWKALPVKPGLFSLLASPIHRTRLEMRDVPPIFLSVGFNGVEGYTRATVEPQGVHALPEALESLFAHPPWHGGARGSVIREYFVSLPEEEEIWFSTAVAIAPHKEGLEPPSDGVTFRLRVLPEEAPEEALGEILFESHTDDKSWQYHRCSLDAYAGQTILLQLETHPGPAWDTTCDRALWGAPQIHVGKEKNVVDPPKHEKQEIGQLSIDGINYDVSFVLGHRGLLDGTVFFEGDEGLLSFQGFSVHVFGEELQKAQGVTELVFVETEPTQKGFLIRHAFESPSGNYDLVADLSVIDDKALCVVLRLENAPASQPWLIPCLESVQTGPWSARADRIYAGMGNVICDPQAFTLAADAHQLATSFVGFDFPTGLSVVQALKAPPSRFVVTPVDKIYSLQAGIAADFHFIPAPNVWSAVKVWRDINGLQAGPGVPQLAGRYGFDLWRGDIKRATEDLKQSFRYGLTNSVVLWHNWQRHGYDYRLPDITPPNTRWGTFQEFLELVAICHDHDVLFAPHDNYIDFYPDADQFSYDHIAFHKNREPFWAWLNKGRGSQAFRWRPMAMRPFLERNVQWIRENIAPSAFFIDVWASVMPCDSWTSDGQLEDRMLCREIWGDSFNWIRDTLGGNAPMISESGHDQLIGSVDGAQANHLRVDVSPPSHPDQGFTWPIACEDAERIPWSDMACHDRFIYHGAGYDPRYKAGEPSELAGIFSDDYMATEMLTGHPAMTTQPFSRDTVRKYWLSNDFMTRIARVALADHAFINDNIHTQQVGYENGAQVWVNRQQDKDWSVFGRILPPMGFYSEAGDSACAIERREGVLVEWSRSPEALYVNARTDQIAYEPVELASSTVTLEKEKYFELSLHWKPHGPLTRGLKVFVHFLNEDDSIAFQADHSFFIGSGKADEPFVTSASRTLPDFSRPGDEFKIRAGIFVEGLQRCTILNSTLEEKSFFLGTLRCEGEDDEITALTYTPASVKINPIFSRFNLEKKRMNFDGIVTDGAFRLTKEENSLVLMPLPENAAFTAFIDLKKLPFTVAVPKRMLREKTDGTRTEQAFSVEQGVLQLHVEADTFALYGE